MIGNTRVGWTDNTYVVQLNFNQYIADHTLAGALNWAKFHNEARKHHHALVVNMIGSPNIEMWTGIPKVFNAKLEFDGMGGDMTTECDVTNAQYGIRYLEEHGDSLYGGPFGPSCGLVGLSDLRNGIVTLTGRNCLPQVLPVRIQNLSLYGNRHLITSDVRMGTDVTEEDDPNPVVFKTGSHTTIEHSGNVVLTKGVTIEKGASLQIIPSKLYLNDEEEIDDCFDDLEENVEEL